jgi:hypothetical protein
MLKREGEKSVCDNKRRKKDKQRKTFFYDCVKVAHRDGLKEVFILDDNNNNNNNNRNNNNNCLNVVAL